ncbi:hypothetical protein C7D72_29820, partial [Klebsiella pneumoniae]
SKAIEGTCLACNAGPHLTDLGLTDGGSRQIVDPPTGSRRTGSSKAIEGTCLACNAGPHLTDLGLTDGGSRQIVDP